MPLTTAVDEATGLICIGDQAPTPCSGPAARRFSLTGASQSVRCEGHYDEYVARVQPMLDAIDARYPVTAPIDFDPAYAGESWDEDY